MVKLLVIPNDKICAYFRTTPKDFLDEVNPGNFFEDVKFLNWKEEEDDEFAGVESKAFLKNKKEARYVLDKVTRERSFSSPMFRDIFLSESKSIESFLLDYKPDVVRTLNTHFAGELGVIAREITGSPLIISAYDPTRITSIVREADSLICESYELKEMCENNFGINPNRISVIHNPIPMDVFYPYSKKDIQKIISTNLINAPYKILSVSRLINGKNIEGLLGAVSQIKKDFPGLVHLHIGGGNDPEKKKQVISLRNKLGLVGTSYFKEQIPKTELPAYYSWADAFVLPTLWEGLSRVVRESLACGTPAITTNYGSTAEIVQDRYNGISINPRDLDDIARGIMDYFSNESLRKHLRNNARSSVVNKYDSESSVQLHIENYKRILKSSRK